MANHGSVPTLSLYQGRRQGRVVHQPHRGSRPLRRRVPEEWRPHHGTVFRHGIDFATILLYHDWNSSLNA